MDGTIRAAAVDLVAVGRPSDSSAGRALLLLFVLVHGDLSEEVLVVLGKIPDLDTSVGGSSQPLVLGVERQRVDLGFALELRLRGLQVEVVPDLDGLVFSTGGDVHTVSGDVKSVDVGVVSLDGSDDSEDTVPDLETTVPADSGVVLGLGGLGEADLGDPLFVVVLVVRGLGRGDLAFGEGVPELDGLFSTGGEDLSVVSGESACEDLLGVADEVSDALAGSEIPKSHGLIPRRGHHEGVVVGDGQIGDEVVVASEALERAAGVAFVVVVVKLPDDERLVTGAGDEDGVVLVSVGGGAVASDDTGHCAFMAVEDANRLDTSVNFVGHF